MDEPEYYDDTRITNHDPIVPEHATPQPGLVEYQCERCGYKYNKVFDYGPFLCYRCMRFIAKRTFTIMNTIQPPISRPEKSEV